MSCVRGQLPPALSPPLVTPVVHCLRETKVEWSRVELVTGGCELQLDAGVQQHQQQQGAERDHCDQPAAAGPAAYVSHQPHHSLISDSIHLPLHPLAPPPPHVAYNVPLHVQSHRLYRATPCCMARYLLWHCVCPSVCHKSEFYQNCCTDRASFRHGCFHRLAIMHCRVITKFR